MNRRRLTEEEQQAIIARYENDESASSIAKVFGVSSTAIKGVIDRHGIPLNPKFARFSGHQRVTTNEQTQIIVDRYTSGETADAIAKSLDIPRITLQRTLERAGVETRPELAKHYLSAEQKQSVVEQAFRGGKTVEQLATSFGVSDKTVFRILKQHNISLPKGPHPFPANHAAFDALTPASAYWMGFLFTDGCVSAGDRSAPSVRINIAEKDIEHVNKLRAFFQSEHAISYGNRTKKTTLGGGPSVSYKLRSRQLVAALEVCGMVPGKVKRTPNPEVGASRDFWRGAVDGDGWLGTSLHYGKYLYPHVGLCGQSHFIDAFVRFLDSNNLVHLNRTMTDSGIWKVATSGSTAGDVIRFLYADAGEALDRKNVRAQDIICGNLHRSEPYVEEPSCFPVDDEDTQS